MSIDVKDLKRGQVVYECEYGYCVKMTIKDDAKRVQEQYHDGWAATGIGDCGGEVELFVSANHGGMYAPKLYNYPAYMKISKPAPKKFAVQYKLEPR